MPQGEKMINIIEETIKPYNGVGCIKLGMTLPQIRAMLKENKTPFNQTVNPNKGCTPEVPWTFIKIFDSITMCFAKDILFSIVVEGKYKGKTAHGLYIGMKMSEAEQLDPTIEYNDEDEDFISKEGYWINDEIESGLICAITIFLPELDSEDFFKYEWVDKYVNRSIAE